jgi:hypothetical protein
MGFIYHDPDAYDVVTTSSPCHSCGGDLRKCDGRCTGHFSYSMVPRSPEKIAEVKRQKRLEHEEQVLAEAEAIKARRTQEAHEDDQG